MMQQTFDAHSEFKCFSADPPRFGSARLSSGSGGPQRPLQAASSGL